MSRSLQPRQRSRWKKAGAAAVTLVGLVGLSAGGWIWLKSHDPGRSGAPSFAKMAITRVLSVPDLRDAALSPDGRYVAYTVSPGSKSRLVVRQLASGQEFDVVPSQSAVILMPTFSPDGSDLFYSQFEPNGRDEGLDQVSTLGGVPRRIPTSPGLVEWLTVAPGGRQVAVLLLAQATQTRSLIMASVDGTARRTLTTFTGGQFAGSPTWAPDGQRIALAVNRSPGSFEWRLAAFSVKDGREEPLSSRTWEDVSGMAWLPDGTGVIVAGRDAGRDVSQLWLMSWPSGAVRRLTNDTNDYSDVSVSSDSATIAAVNNRGGMSLWTASTDHPEGATRAAGGQLGDYLYDLARLRNGDVRFTRSGRTGDGAIWRAAPDGSAQRRLTPGGLNAGSARSATLADVIVFSTFSRDFRTRAMWRMDSDGSGLAEIPGSRGGIASGISADGKTVFFVKVDPKNPSHRPLWKMPVAGGAEEFVAEQAFAAPGFSPDGRLFFRTLAWGPDAPRGVEVVAAVGEKPLRSLELPADAYYVQWTPSSDALTYVHRVDDRSDIWRQPIDGRAAQQITHFPPGQDLGGYALTADGSRLLFIRSESGSSEVLLMKNFR